MWKRCASPQGRCMSARGRSGPGATRLTSWRGARGSGRRARTREISGETNAKSISQLMTDLAGSARDDLLGKLKCNEEAITEDSLLYVLADYANLILCMKKSTARATIYSDCEPQYRQIMSVLKPEDDARSRKRELADSDDGGNIKKARVEAAPPPTSLEGPSDSAMLLLLQKLEPQLTLFHPARLAHPREHKAWHRRRRQGSYLHPLGT